jgi:hypothetical protein
MNDSPDQDVDDDIYKAETPSGQVADQAPKFLEDEEGDSENPERVAAFNSGPPSWNGKVLRPWTSARESHWIEVRHALGARHISECILSSYTFLPDAFRILFLCHAQPEVIQSLRADPLKFQAAVDEWVDEHVPIARHDEANTIAMRIYNLAHKNHPESAPAENTDHGDDLGN